MCVCVCMYIYMYVYISAVKISTLTQAIHLFSLTRNFFLMPLTQRRVIAATSVPFFLTSSAFIQSQQVFTTTSNRRRFRRASRARREINERGKRSCTRGACSCTHKCARRAVALSFHIKARNKLRACNVVVS